MRKVVDGDTLRLQDGRSVRLIGINAPELAHDGRAAEAFGEAARKRMSELVERSNGQVRLDIGAQPRDHYGRVLASVYDADGRSLEERLLADGLAYQVAIAPNTGQVDCLREAERRARASALGLWRRPAWLQPGSLRQSGFALIHGRVLRVERNRGGLWLEMDGPLVLHIDLRDLSRFDGETLRAAVGRDIEVRGWVVDRSRRGQLKMGQARWLLSLSHPAMIAFR